MQPLAHTALVLAGLLSAGALEGHASRDAAAVTAGTRIQDTGAEAALVVLPKHFGSHMVLQRDRPIRVYGRALPGASLSVSFAGTTRRARADARGSWELALPAQAAEAKGRSLVVSAQLGERSKRIELDDVVCGDVWLCAGQSNMRWRVRQAAEAEALLERAASFEKAARVDLRLLDFEGRLYPSKKEYSLDFLRELSVDNYYTTKGWQRASRRSAASFSAVAFSFGLRLVDEVDVPIGLVHNAIGGVPMEAYLPSDGEHVAKPVRELMKAWWTDERYPAWCVQRARENLAAWLRAGEGPRPKHPFAPGFLYEAGITPIARTALRGVIWYQGESNATTSANGAPRDPELNRASFESLIDSFRAAFGAPRLPFYFVQLPGLARRWAPFREMQLDVARSKPGAGMAVTIDLGHPSDVHPRRKREVGERLARLALVSEYGRKLVATGPLYREHSVEGAELRVRFEHAIGLQARDGERLRGFVIAGEDRVFHTAHAFVEGGAIVVRSAKVARARAVRYAWANDPDGNLVNGEGLPASPFRSDRWPLDAPPAMGATPQDAAQATAAQQSGVESFESAKAGPLREFDGKLGRFEAKEGHAEINARFAKTGRQSLRLFGGRDRRVFWTLPKQLGERELAFWAERWTRRAPFAFSIEAQRKGTWAKVFDGTRSVVVGRGFLSRVRVRLPEDCSALRFVCSTASGGGLLIDDLELRKPEPMRWLGARHAEWVAPALHGHAFNAVARIEIATQGEQKPLELRRVRVALGDETRLDDVSKVALFVTPTKAFSQARPFGKAKAAARKLDFAANAALNAGTTQLWIAIALAKGASIDRRVGARCAQIELGDGRKFAPRGASAAQRVGVALRRAGQDDCHTYRIPGLATTNKGTLIAVYDCRYRSSRDLPGDIDVGMSRSVDGGQTWEPRRVILDMGRDKKWSYDGVGDPAVLVDRKRGTIWVAATWSHGNRSWNGSGPGLEPKDTGQFMLTRSDDDGKTWSKPINITRQVKNPAWRFVLAGPGKGITLRDGTLVFAAQYRSSDESEFGGKPFSTLIYSKDDGKTWKIGSGVKVDTTEAQIVELADGRLMINCRDNRGRVERGARSVYTSANLGRTWQVHKTSRRALPEPVCMASLIRLEHERHGPLLVFSNPASRRARHRMTIKLSRDEGASWPSALHSLYDERRGAGYSCLTRIDKEHVGVLYEGHRELYFLRFSIAELLAVR